MLLLLCVAMMTYAQGESDASSSSGKKEKTLTVYMQVKDHISHDGIDSTLTGRILMAKDSSMVDTLGIRVEKRYDGKRESYALAKLKQPGDYLFELKAQDYTTKYVPFSIAKFYKNERYMELKTQYLRRIQKGLEVELGEVVVKATKLKFYMDGDTLTYNADAFNLSEGSMMSALIKKMPGVELKDGGEITVNGQKVDALLLNGKDFFDSDRELMLENMPAYMVKSIQSYERTPEKTKGTNHEKSEKKELVMNVKLKREYNKGWMMNAEGGLGTSFYKDEDGKLSSKFMGRLFGLRYSDKSQLMLYANANNLNDDRTPGEKGEWSPLTQSQGLMETYKAGATYTTGSWEHFRYKGSANTYYKESDDRNHENQQTFLEGGDTYGRSFYKKLSYDVRFDTNHEIYYRTKEPGKWYKYYAMLISPRFQYLKWDNHSMTASTTLNADVAEQWGKDWMDSIAAPNAGGLLKKYAINRQITSTKGIGDWTNAGTHADFNFSPAHNDVFDFEVAVNYDYTRKKEDAFNHNRLDFPSSDMPTDFTNRFNPTMNEKNSFTVTPTMSINLSSKDSIANNINFYYYFSYVRERSDNNMYLLNRLQGWGEDTENTIGMLPSEEEMIMALDTENSIRSTTTTTTQSPTLHYTFVNYRDKGTYRYLTFNLSLPIKKETLDYWQGDNIDTLFSRNTVFFQPTVQFYKVNNKRGMTINASYNMNTSAPGMTNLINTSYTNNPLVILKSNPDLKNTTTHNFNAGYRNKFGRSLLFNVGGNWQITQNSSAYGYIYNKETGGRTYKPENVNGNWNVSFNSGIDFALDSLEKWRVFDRVNYRYNHSVDLNGTDPVIGAKESVVGSSYIDNSVGLTFRPTDKIEIAAKGNMHYQRSTSDRTDFITLNVWDFDYGLTAQVELPWDLQVSTDVTMYSRRGYNDSSMNTDEFVWNARLTKKLMKGNLLIHVDGFDFLGKLSNIRRYINAQGKTETFYNVIPSYGLVRIAWKFNKKPKKG